MITIESSFMKRLNVTRIQQCLLILLCVVVFAECCRGKTDCVVEKAKGANPWTHLYHTYLDPVIASSSFGTYRAACDEGTIRKTSDTAPDYDYYCGWALWDNFCKFSLLALTEPEIMQNVARSLVDYYEHRYQGPFHAGEFYWPTPTEAQGIEGLHFAAIVIADAWAGSRSRRCFRACDVSEQERAT